MNTCLRTLFEHCAHGVSRSAADRCVNGTDGRARTSLCSDAECLVTMTSDPDQTPGHGGQVVRMWSGCLPTMTTTSELRKASTRDQLPIMTTDLPDWSTRGRDLRECLEAGLVTYNLVTMTSAQRK